jgi:hypothetical protein
MPESRLLENNLKIAVHAILYHSTTNKDQPIITTPNSVFKDKKISEYRQYRPKTIQERELAYYRLTRGLLQAYWRLTGVVRVKLWIRRPQVAYYPSKPIAYREDDLCHKEIKIDYSILSSLPK